MKQKFSMSKFFLFLFATCCAFSLLMSCGDDDDVSCATYEKNVKAIIDKSCAYSGCHSGADAGMFVSDISKDYTNYEGILGTLNNGAFKIRALDSLNMPPPFFTPEDKPQSLTADEIDIFTCWIEAGYPKS
jgi:hypothetical protein